MAFEQTKKLFRGYWLNPKKPLAALSAGAMLFGFWFLIGYLKSLPFFSDILTNGWVLFFRSLPIAFLAGLNFLDENAYIVALRNDWLELSIKTHLIITGIVIMATMVMHALSLKDKPTPNTEDRYLA
jgi:quinol-cytochrome oxidoreductase complex cytochrome b subunit